MKKPKWSILHSLLLLLWAHTLPSQSIQGTTIFFETASSNVEAKETLKLDSLLQVLNSCPPCRVKIIGFTDDVGNESYNLKLAERRCASVKHKLETAGFKGVIHTQAIGESHLNNSPTPSTDQRWLSRKVEVQIFNDSSTYFRLRVYDADSQILRDPNYFFKGPKGAISTQAEKLDDGTLVFKIDPPFRCEIQNKGFFFNNFLVRKPNSDTSIYLQAIEKGRSRPISGLEFRGGMDLLISRSIPKIQMLAQWLRDNPTIKIELVGHVNRVESPSLSAKMRADDLNLSYRRAVRVKNELVKMEIDAARLEVKGMGNKEMLYPNPKTPEENQKNRRVEVKIVDA